MAHPEETEHLHRHLSGCRNLLDSIDAFLAAGDRDKAALTWGQFCTDTLLLTQAAFVGATSIVRRIHAEALEQVLIDFKTFDKNGHATLSLRSIDRAEKLLDVSLPKCAGCQRRLPLEESSLCEYCHRDHAKATA